MALSKTGTGRILRILPNSGRKPPTPGELSKLEISTSWNGGDKSLIEKRKKAAEKKSVCQPLAQRGILPWDPCLGQDLTRPRAHAASPAPLPGGVRRS
jgi:hypothetical protein